MRSMRSAIKILAIEGRQTIQEIQNTSSESDGRHLCGPPKLDPQNKDSAALGPPRVVQETLRGEQSSGASTNRVNETRPASKPMFLAQPRIGRSASEPSTRNEHGRESFSNLPMTVKDAARFLGVSPQTVYLWVERKQIPHLRVMGRNIRFLKSDLKPFRAQFKQEVENGKTA
jgi:excisionase family DNA binding protein